MKPNLFSKILGQSKTLRLFRLALAAPALIITVSVSQAGTSAPSSAPAEEPELANWISFTIGGAFVSGDDQGFMARTRTNGDFYGGIDSAQYTKELNDSTTLSIDGHALPGLEDYEINIDVEKADLGYIKTGFKQFRTWYDASGGYLEGANMDASLVDSVLDDERYIDRGEFYFETGLRMENLPEITFSYRHLYRDGDKDSTCWGDSRANTSWGGISGSNPAFKFMPAIWEIDESADIFELDVQHTLGNTELGAGLVYESYEYENSRYTPRWGSKPTGVGSGSTTDIVDVTLTEKTDADIFAGNIHSVTRFNDKAWLSFAASYSNTITDIDGGSREYGVYWPTPIPNSPTRRDYAYDQMSGGSNVNQFITNLNFMWVPVTDLTITPSLRYENESIDTYSNFRAFNTNQTWQGLQKLGAYSDMDSMTGALDIRYSGFDNIVLFAKGQWGNENEDVLREDRILPGEFLDSDIDIDEQEYVLGANWYAMRNLSFSVQGFHSTRDQSLDHEVGNQPKASNSAPGGANNFRPIMTEHDVEVDDFNLRMTWRPLSNLSLVTRYDYQHSQIDNRGINWSPPAAPIEYPIIESGDIKSHILSQSVTWNPLDRMYVQGSLSWASSETDTPEKYTGDSDNDYIVGSLSAGYSIDARTEVTASYSYFTASNYVNSVGYTGVDTMGYGLNTNEHAISLTLTRVLTENMIWNLRYGFITSNTDGEDQSGGYNDFDAHMVSTGLQVRF
jgi:hypothetical protein